MRRINTKYTCISCWVVRDVWNYTENLLPYTRRFRGFREVLQFGTALLRGRFNTGLPTTEKCLDNQTDHCTYSLLWHDIQFDRERISPSARNHRSNMARVRQAFDHAGILIHTSSREEDQASWMQVASIILDIVLASSTDLGVWNVPS